MSIRPLPAKLHAIACPPTKLLISLGEQEAELNQWVIPKSACPPRIAPTGGQENQLFQLLKPASTLPRLTTCARVGEHIVGLEV